MKRTLCILLSLMLMLTGLVGLGVSVSATNVGDLIEFGSYPQTKVSETTALKNAANAATWKSYGYYTGNGIYDGNMTASDFMKYADFVSGGVKYRAVIFTKYRPFSIGYPSSADNSVQYDNGYYTNTTYYFKYEPLEWRVLDPSVGLVLCETIIDAQAYQNVVRIAGDYYYIGSSSTYANNYAESSIRTWLNNDFYNTAFNSVQKEKIKNTTVNNGAYSTEYSQYDAVSTTDPIFLLSYSEAQNSSYGLSSSSARKAIGTDYAKCQGLCDFNSGFPYWLLRSAGYLSFEVCGVVSDGGINSDYVFSTNIGIRPALCLNPSKTAHLNVPQSVTVGYKSTVTVTATADNIPTYYFVALYDGDAQLAKGDNKTVSYTMTKMKAGKTLTAKVIDLNGSVQSSAHGNLEKEIKITVKTGFFDKVKAFFLGLFGLLPKITLNPKPDK